MTTFVYFKSEHDAQNALTKHGFSLGRLQAGSPRGIIHGDVDIAKWRNLKNADRDALHGVYQRQFRDGPVEIALHEHCPSEHRDSLVKSGFKDPAAMAEASSEDQVQ